MNFFARYEKKTVSKESFQQTKKDPLVTMYNEFDTISTEDFNDFTKYLGVKFAKLSIAVKDAFEVLTTWNYKPMEDLNFREFQMIMNKLDYLEIKNIQVPQPVSFNGTLLDYLEDSKKRFEFIAKFNEQILTPAIKRFSHYLDNPEERADRRDFVPGIEVKDREKMIQDNARWFDYRQREANAMFGTIYHSNSDFVKCLYLTEQYKKTVGSSGSADAVTKRVNDLKKLIIVLMERLGKDEIKPSQEFLDMVSVDVKEIAKWVEFYSLIMAMLMDVNSCLTQTEDILKDLV